MKNVWIGERRSAVGSKAELDERRMRPGPVELAEEVAGPRLFDKSKAVASELPAGV